MRCRNLLKHLFLFPALVLLGVAGKAQLINESFDGTTFPPTGWNVTHTTGADPTAVWERAVANTEGSDPGALVVSPHSGAGMIIFRSYDFAAGNGSYIATPSFSMVAAGSQKVSLWMYRDNVLYTNEDSVSVYINTAQNLTGATYLGKILRRRTYAPVEAADGWYQYSFAIPASFTGATNYVLIHAAGEFGNNMFVDDVLVENNPICSGTPTPGSASISATFLCGAGTVDLDLAGYTAASGISVQWQSSPAGANTFTNIGGATTAAYTASVGASLDFRARVTCSNGGAFAFSDTVSITFNAGPPANDEVCSATPLTAGGAAQCGNTTCATTALDEPESGCSASNNTVWYSFTPAITGFYNILLERPATGTDYLDAWVHLFTGPCASVAAPPLNADCTAGDAVVLTVDASGIVTTPSLTAGTQYLIRLDGVAGSFGSYCISIDIAPPPPGCTTNLLPANASANVASPITFSWNAATGADGYAFILGTNNPPNQAGDTLGTTAGTVVQLTGLQANTTYYWYVVPFNSGGVASGCISNVTSFTTTNPPANNECSGAVNLPVTDGFCGSPVLGTLALADSAVGFTSPLCSPTARPDDVWYTVTVPASGNVVVQTSAVNEDVVDLVAEAYSGTCGGVLTRVACSDDDNPDDFSAAVQYHSRLSLSGRTPGEVLYIRVMPFSIGNEGAFAICAWDSSAVAPISTGTGCTNAIAVNIDSAYKYTWASLKDASGNIVAQVFPNGSILGNTSASYYVNTAAVRQVGGTFYLDRNVTVTPTTQPNGDVLTRVYFTDAELQALAAAAGATTPADLNCTKTSQTCATSAAIANGGTYYDQFTSGDYGGFDHFVDVLHDSYSTFYLHKGTVVLPVSLASFNAVRSGRVNKLNWTTSLEVNLNNFVVQRSTNGREYREIGSVVATGNTNNTVNYNFIDEAPVRALNYYRLKIVDNNGQVKYSPVRTVRNEGTADVYVAPNPVTGVAVVKLSSDVQDRATITITDMNGKAVYRSVSTIASGSNNIEVNMGSFAAGTYVVKVQLTNDFVIKKINKQ